MMQIFNNSEIELSKAFIVGNIDHVEWKCMTRQLPEPIIDRYALRVINWNAQLYGQLRTYEFIVRHCDRFDWKRISLNPPNWFSDIHFEVFGHLMDWKCLSRFSKKIDARILFDHADELDWDIISMNDIRSESFATIYLNKINWDHPQLDVSCLSTEFLYDVYQVRHLAHDVRTSPTMVNIPYVNPLSIRMQLKLADGLVLDAPPRIGATVSAEFMMEHGHELDWEELNSKGLLTDEFVELLADSV